MATFRNAFGETRWLPSLGYRKVDPGETVTVPDSEVVNWLTGEWEQVDGPRFHWDPEQGKWVPDEVPAVEPAEG